MHSEVCLLHTPRARSADCLETPNPSSNCWTTEIKTFILYKAGNRESRFFSPPGGQWPLTGVVDCSLRHHCWVQHRDRLYMRGGHNHFDVHILGFICLLICLFVYRWTEQAKGGTDLETDFSVITFQLHPKWSFFPEWGHNFQNIHHPVLQLRV